jgi:hypothetical protein
MPTPLTAHARGRRAGTAIVGVVLALTGCFRDDYPCKADADCDLGELGRCELDHRCTQIDPGCLTNRRYTAHAGPHSGACFDDSAVPINPCAAGQPPAPPRASLAAGSCAALVCDALPTCCQAGWAEACVQEAQLRCDLRCDTRIAISATTAAGAEEAWDVRFDPAIATWSATSDARHAGLVWLAPAPGSAAPQLAGFRDGAFAGDGFAIPLRPGQDYREAVSVDFDRDGRPTVALGFSSPNGLEIAKLDDQSIASVASSTFLRMSWGDLDHDGFPDAIAAGFGANVTSYKLLTNTQVPMRVGRTVSESVAFGVGTPTTGVPIRSLDWMDLQSGTRAGTDGQLEAVVYGNRVAVHSADLGKLLGGAAPQFDCAPPIAIGMCAAADQPNTAFAGAALPASAGPPHLVVATAPLRAAYRLASSGPAAPYALPVCPTCPPIVAVVTRDLDGDHELDVIAIDSDLRIFTATGGSLTFTEVPGKPATAGGFASVRTSVSGAPR